MICFIEEKRRCELEVAQRCCKRTVQKLAQLTEEGNAKRAGPIASSPSSSELCFVGIPTAPATVDKAMRSPDFRISCTPANFDKARPSAIRRWTARLLYQPRFGGIAWRPASNSRSTYMNTTSGYVICSTTAHRKSFCDCLVDEQEPDRVICFICHPTCGGTSADSPLKHYCF